MTVRQKGIIKKLTQQYDFLSYIRSGGMVVVFESTMDNCSAGKCNNSLLIFPLILFKITNDK